MSSGDDEKKNFEGSHGAREHSRRGIRPVAFESLHTAQVVFAGSCQVVGLRVWCLGWALGHSEPLA